MNQRWPIRRTKGSTCILLLDMLHTSLVHASIGCTVACCKPRNRREWIVDRSVPPYPGRSALYTAGSAFTYSHENQSRRNTFATAPVDYFGHQNHTKSVNQFQAMTVLSQGRHMVERKDRFQTSPIPARSPKPAALCTGPPRAS